MFIYPPANENELITRAYNLSGFNLGELAANLNIKIPINLKRNKGWVGMLIERLLGASAGSKQEQDFANIGIELKTIPLNSSNGKPLETTFVCMAQLITNKGITWEKSYVRYKLSRVLWIPIEAQIEIPIPQRRIGNPLLWSPNIDEERQLKQDWEELLDLIVLGKIDNITSSYGEVLQLKHKSANNRALTAAIGEFGNIIFTIPRGFYLKKCFTSRLLSRNFMY